MWYEEGREREGEREGRGSELMKHESEDRDPVINNTYLHYKTIHEK